jgi:large subunit ribosomal protein L1
MREGRDVGGNSERKSKIFIHSFLGEKQMKLESLKKALEEIKKGKERKFDQTVDLIINLRGVDIKKSQVNIVVNVPNKVKDKKVCGFFMEKSKFVDSITELEFKKYSEKNMLKNLVKKYDYFIAIAPLMPKVATTFGKVLGPVGKMPSPQLGIIVQENEKSIQDTLDKIAVSLKIRLKEASIKVPVGKLSMEDSKIIENVTSIYKAVEDALPKKKENVKNILVKLSMGKPVKVEI